LYVSTKDVKIEIFHNQ